MGCRLWGRTESDTTEAKQQQQQQYMSGVGFTVVNKTDISKLSQTMIK